MALSKTYTKFKKAQRARKKRQANWRFVKKESHDLEGHWYAWIEDGKVVFSHELTKKPCGNHLYRVVDGLVFG